MPQFTKCLEVGNTFGTFHLLIPSSQFKPNLNSAQSGRDNKGKGVVGVPFSLNSLLWSVFCHGLILLLNVRIKALVIDGKEDKDDGESFKEQINEANINDIQDLDKDSRIESNYLGCIKAISFHAEELECNFDAPRMNIVRCSLAQLREFDTLVFSHFP